MPYGVRMGLAAETVEAIRRGVRPSNLPKDEQAIYDFADEFLRTHAVSDATLNAARSVLGGDRGIVDLVGTMGLYQIVDDGGAGQDAAAAGREAVFPVAGGGRQHRSRRVGASAKLTYDRNAIAVGA